MTRAEDLIHWSQTIHSRDAVGIDQFHRAFEKLQAFDAEALELVIQQVRDYDASVQAELDAGEDI